MSRAVALLRGINVGGRARIPMADLRQVVSGLGLRDVRTYLQSGNVVFTPPDEAGGEVPAALETAIAERFGLDIRVLVRTGEELAAIAARNPFVEKAANLETIHTVFLERAPTEDRLAAVDPDRSPPDEFTLSGREIFVHYPNGSGRSKLTLDYFERRLEILGTARNWNTVTRLVALANP